MTERSQFEVAELDVLMRELRSVLEADIAGNFVELGCYKGETSLHIARFLSRLAPDRHLYIYDSFEGLPDKSNEDQSPAGEQFKAGELPAGRKEVVTRLKAAGLNNVTVKKAWFANLTEDDLPETIALAFLDGDFYKSILDSLRLVWPLMASGGTIVIDDYRNEALPGAARAVDQWLRSHPAKFRVEKSLGIIRL